MLDFTKYYRCLISIDCRRHKYLFMRNHPHMAFPVKVTIQHPSPAKKLRVYVGINEDEPNEAYFLMLLTRKEFKIKLNDLRESLLEQLGSKKKVKEVMDGEGIWRLWLLIESKVETKALASFKYFGKSQFFPNF